ncbi:vascular-related unknown protein 4 isoform X1 [Populus alba]|uniref:Uncharacterized protein n=1 Tax=Populus alba TaxID=43335 RepID=A0A4U5R736_POPAL|nr:vascular-related unknown protein 4-like [Populus alba]TKS18115.1 hypothetical protein D5086_0000005980 [Populus alba]
MENSMSCKPFSSSSNEKTTDDSFEESGWTMYFEDFFAQNNREDCDHDFNEHSSFSFDHDGSSPMVSDAASLAVMKSAGDHHGERVVGLPIDNKSFKKRRTKGALLDDALEDTASSPVNSPKVNDDTMISQYKRNTKQKDKTEISQDKGSASGQIDMRSDLGFILRESDSTELQKRGLCLVPLSMAVNYLG